MGKNCFIKRSEERKYVVNSQLQNFKVSREEVMYRYVHINAASDIWTSKFYNVACFKETLHAH